MDVSVLTARRDSKLFVRACQFIVCVVYPISRVRLLLRSRPNPGTDLDTYFEWVRRAAGGAVPYADFPIDYPPGAWLLIRAPGAPDWAAYVHRFARIATGLEIAAFAVFVLIARAVAPRGFWIVTATYVVATTLLREMITVRLDSGLLFLLMLWAWLALTATDAPTDRRRAASYVVLGVATSFKLVPAVMLPLALLHDWRRPRANRWALPLCFAAGVALPFVVIWPESGSAAFRFLTYHVERGLEVESVWATIVWPLRWLGVPMSVMDVGHSVDLISRPSQNVAAVSMIVSVGAVGLCLTAETIRPWRGSAVVPATIGLLSFVAVAKVLSPQYFLWMLPLVLIAVSETARDEGGYGWWCASVVLLAALTLLIYPYFFVAVREMQPLGFALLLARNLLLVAMIVSLARRVWTR